MRVHRQIDLRVPERFHDGPRIDALREQQCCRGVPQVVEPDEGKVRAFEDGFEFAVDVPRIEWVIVVIVRRIPAPL